MMAAHEVSQQTVWIGLDCKPHYKKCLLKLLEASCVSFAVHFLLDPIVSFILNRRRFFGGFFFG